MKFLEAIRKGAEPSIWGSRPGPTGGNWMPRVWQPGSRLDYQSEAGDLWLNGVVMMALRFKACAISEMRPCAQEWSDRDAKWIESVDPTAVEWLGRFVEPNDDYDWSVMMGSVLLSDDTSGQGYLIKRTDNLNRPRGGYRYEPHFLMEPDSDDVKKLITKYWYGAPGGTREPLAVKDVVHIRQSFINPRERRLGLTPLAAVLRDVCADNELTNWLASILRNGAVPSHMVIPKGDDSGQMAALWESNKGSIKDLFKSFIKDARGEILTAPSPMEVVKLMWSPAELEIATLQQGPSARICGAMGTDPMVLGLPSPNKTYSNFAEAVDACGKLTILPTVRRWMSQFSKQTAPDFGLDPKRFRIWLATDTVSWLQDETNELHERVRADFVANLIDLYRAKELIGEKPDEKDRGVYSWELKPAPVVTPGQKPKEEAKHLDRVRRSAEALKEMGL